MSSTNYYFILGAADPEMTAIEDVLRQKNASFGYATAGGRRVHSGNAYAADGIEDKSSPNSGPFVFVDKEIVFVECKVRGVNAALVVDHHAEGHPGFNLPPVDFWFASSIGQVCRLLDVQPSEELWYIAAADHCLAAAYHGLCPGVDPGKLFELRVRQKAAFTKKPVELIREKIEKAIQALKDCDKVIQIAGVAVKDTRGQVIDELPEAAAMLGTPFLAEVRDPDGRRKIVLQAAPPDVVEEFAKVTANTLGLKDVYAMPIRGLAGGYID